MADPERRRRRLRHHPAGDVPTGRPPAPDEPGSTSMTDAEVGTAPSAQTTGVHDPVPDRPGPRRRSGSDPGPAVDDREGERGLRGLVGSGSSQLSLGAALRARDAARPTEGDLAEAERRLVVVRRNWVPREDLPRTDRG